MFRLHWLQAEQWALHNEQEDEVFRGTLMQCENWLDACENDVRCLRSQTSRKPLGALRLWHAWFLPLTFLPQLNAKSVASDLSQRST